MSQKKVQQTQQNGVMIIAFIVGLIIIFGGSFVGLGTPALIAGLLIIFLAYGYCSLFSGRWW